MRYIGSTTKSYEISIPSSNTWQLITLTAPALTSSDSTVRTNIYLSTGYCYVDDFRLTLQ